MAAPMLGSVIPVAVAPIILVNEYSPGRLVQANSKWKVLDQHRNTGWRTRLGTSSTVARGSLFLQCRDCLSISGSRHLESWIIACNGHRFFRAAFLPCGLLEGLSMIGTIIPTVCGSSSQQMNISKPGLLALHGLGYVIGAIAAGAALGMVGQLILILFAAKPTGGFVFTAIGIVSVLYGLTNLDSSLAGATIAPSSTTALAA